MNLTAALRVLREQARSKSVQRVTHQVAEDLAARARQIDPAGDFHVEDIVINVNGLDRVATSVTNRAPDAVRKEFGGAKQSGERPLGRATAYVKR